MAKYFKIDEFICSEKAKVLKINNTPDAEIEEHIEELMEFLDGLREAWGSGIHVNSGYRCPELNRAVKGSKTSAHLTGYAADLSPTNGRMKEFYSKVMEWIKGKKFDQVINEYPNTNGVPSWVHIGLKNGRGEQRGQYLTIK